MGTRGHFFWTPQLPLLLTALTPSVRSVLVSSPNAKDMYSVWESKRRHCIPSFPVSDCVITNLPTCQCKGHAFWPPHLESLCHLLSTNCFSDEAWSGLWIEIAFNFFLLIVCLFL
uniref:Secreted protein n=1 Tax=Ixodes ricinus TaxID=34613 RepID=A0A6B0ULC2_IXORI